MAENIRNTYSITRYLSQNHNNNSRKYFKECKLYNRDENHLMHSKSAKPYVRQNEGR
jgi:hypothetical protein